MIDDVETSTYSEPAKPTRPRPPARQRPSRANGQPSAPTHPNGTPDTLQWAEMQARLEALERQQTSQFVEQQPQPRPEVFHADPSAAPTDLLRKLAERTSPTPPDYRPEGVTYNHKNRWFMRPDLDVVELPGSPETIKMYLEMGFTLLSEAETRQWLEHDREIVLKDQRERARLINAVRAAASVDPKLAYAVSDEAELDMQRMTTPELRERAKAVVGDDMKHLARPQRLIDAEEKAAGRRDKQMRSGVDTADTMTMEQLEHKKQRGGGRAYEITQRNSQYFAT